jgi:hypothetical protein
MAIDRRTVLGLLIAESMFLIVSRDARAAAAPSIKVFKDPACGCCSNWVKHVEANGFSASVETSSDLDALKRSFGVPDALRSCHTAIVAGYVLEGHVPSREIKRLLAERPKGRGLAVPGMPVGSPGMEVQGQVAGPYEVFLLGNDGSYSSFASYR